MPTLLKLHEAYSYTAIAEYEASGLTKSEATMAFCLESGLYSAKDFETIRSWYLNDEMKMAKETYDLLVINYYPVGSSNCGSYTKHKPEDLIDWSEIKRDQDYAGWVKYLNGKSVACGI